MFSSSASSPHRLRTDTISASLTCGTESTSQTPSPCRSHSENELSTACSHGPNGGPEHSNTVALERNGPPISGRTAKVDVVLEQRPVMEAKRAASRDDLQFPMPDRVNVIEGCTLQDQWVQGLYDSYLCEHIEPQHWYPNPEDIRHLYTIHSLLRHVQPERKLNALGGLAVDVVEGYTGNIFCRAVPKKMLVLFLGRDTVSKYLHTISRKDDLHWSGTPVQQHLVLPPGVASAAAITILVSWMTRACKYTTMHTMKQLRIPNNLFAACSLAQTLEVFNLHKDAYRVDCAISQQHFGRPMHVVELETLWRCLGEDSRYVYGCIKAFGKQSRVSSTIEDLQSLAERHPRLHERIYDSSLNDKYKPQFGREWFGRLRNRCYDNVQAEHSHLGASASATPKFSTLAKEDGYCQVQNRSGARPLNAGALAFHPMSFAA